MLSGSNLLSALYNFYFIFCPTATPPSSWVCVPRARLSLSLAALYSSSLVDGELTRAAAEALLPPVGCGLFDQIWVIYYSLLTRNSPRRYIMRQNCSARIPRRRAAVMRAHTYLHTHTSARFNGSERANAAVSLSSSLSL